MVKETTLSNTVMQSANAAVQREAKQSIRLARLLQLNRELQLESTMYTYKCGNSAAMKNFKEDKNESKNSINFFRGKIFQNCINMSHT